MFGSVERTLLRLCQDLSSSKELENIHIYEVIETQRIRLAILQQYFCTNSFLMVIFSAKKNKQNNFIRLCAFIRYKQM